MTNNNSTGRQKRPTLDLDDYIAGVLSGNRATLGQAISLVESNRPDHQSKAQQLLQALLPHSGRAHRIGISGSPGAGKSTFIDAFGTNLTEDGRKVAVLAIDPSSGVSGGSILGDKTRMNRLSRDPRAFIRPSPTSGSLGGVNRKTRETMICCEAAGFDTIIVETVGVGQSELTVANMVDFFLVLMLPGGGDELQGIKRGILEIADLIAVNKADADPIKAKIAQQEYRNGLRLMRPTSPSWKAEAVVCSALKNEGLDTIWEKVQKHRVALETTGELQEKRQSQEKDWMWRLVEEQLLHSFRNAPGVQAQLPDLEAQVTSGAMTPSRAATLLIETFNLVN